MAETKSSTWVCECGYENEPEFDRCLMCSRGKPNTNTAVSTVTDNNAVVSSNVAMRAEQVMDKGSEGLDSLASRDIGKTVESVPLPQKLSTQEINHIIDKIRRGEEYEISHAVKKLVEAKPIEAILPLLKIAQGDKVKDDSRRTYAILALGEFGNASVITALTDIKKPELIPSICIALENIKHPSALPYLINIVKKGLSIPFNLSLGKKSENSIRILAQAYAMKAIASIGKPEGISPLINIGLNDLIDPMYMDDNAGSSSNLLIFIAQTAVKNSSTNKMTAIATSFMVDRTARVEMALDFPGEIRKMFMLQHRRRALETLCTTCGPDPFLACFLKAKDPLQRLMIALPLIDCGHFEQRWFDCLAESTKSKFNLERILAYDGFVRVASHYNDHGLIEWGRSGLNDKDGTVQLAVAASILFNRFEPLLLAAINFKNSTKSTTRAGILPPIAYLAATGDPRGEKALQELGKDRDKMVRDLAIEYLHDLPEAKEEFKAIYTEREALIQALKSEIDENIQQAEQGSSGMEEAIMTVSESKTLGEEEERVDEHKFDNEIDSITKSWNDISPVSTDTKFQQPVGSDMISTLPDIAYCMFCGQKTLGDEVYCTNCGKRLEI